EVCWWPCPVARAVGRSGPDAGTGVACPAPTGPQEARSARDDSRAVPGPIAFWRADQRPSWPRPAGAPAARERRPDARQPVAGPEGPWRGAGGPVVRGGGSAAAGAEAGGEGTA